MSRFGRAVGAAGGGAGAATGAAIGTAAGSVGGAVAGGALKYGRDRNGYNQAYASCTEAHGYTVR
jgi:hypothetical protein